MHLVVVGAARGRRRLAEVDGGGAAVVRVARAVREQAGAVVVRIAGAGAGGAQIVEAVKAGVLDEKSHHSPVTLPPAARA